MEVNTIVKLLRKMKIETGSLACLGCGYEHGCSLHGCAILREAADALERMSAWISVDERLPDDEDQVLVIVSGKPMSNLTLENAYELAEYTPEGWILEAWPEWEDAKVTYWTPLPEAPEKGGAYDG